MNVDIYVDERLTAYPGLFCAHCGKTIKDASDANLVFKESLIARAPVIKAGIHTVHKCCDQPFTQMHPVSENEKYSWIQLDAALHMLLRNCGYQPSRAKRSAKIAAL